MGLPLVIVAKSAMAVVEPLIVAPQIVVLEKYATRLNGYVRVIRLAIRSLAPQRTAASIVAVRLGMVVVDPSPVTTPVRREWNAKTMPAFAPAPFAVLALDFNAKSKNVMQEAHGLPVRCLIQQESTPFIM
jgi:hypothetical protein